MHLRKRSQADLHSFQADVLREARRSLCSLRCYPNEATIRNAVQDVFAVSTQLERSEYAAARPEFPRVQDGARAEVRFEVNGRDSDWEWRWYCRHYVRIEEAQ